MTKVEDILNKEKKTADNTRKWLFQRMGIFYINRNE